MIGPLRDPSSPPFHLRAIVKMARLLGLPVAASGNRDAGSWRLHWMRRP